MIFFQNWTELARIAAGTLLVFFFVIACVRLLGKRTTSKMNNFDWIVTVALGSMLGSTVLLKKVVLLDGLVGLATLVFLQYALTKLAVLCSPVSRAIHATPTLLLYNGEPLTALLRKERVTRGELLSAVRSQGFQRLDDVKAVVLESNAEFSVLGFGSQEQTETLTDVHGLPAEQRDTDDRPRSA